MDKWMDKWLIGCFAVLVGFFLLGLVLSNSATDSAPAQTQVYDLSNLMYTEVTSGSIYQATDLLVIDCFAESTENGKTDVMYYLVAFEDYNGRIIAASMPVQTTDTIYWELLRYASNESAQIGDCVVDCYVRAQPNTTGISTTNSQKVLQYFSEAVEQYGDILGDTLIPLELTLSYYCAISADPLTK